MNSLSQITTVHKMSLKSNEVENLLDFGVFIPKIMTKRPKFSKNAVIYEFSITNTNSVQNFMEIQ